MEQRGEKKNKSFVHDTNFHLHLFCFMFFFFFGMNIEFLAIIDFTIEIKDENFKFLIIF